MNAEGGLCPPGRPALDGGGREGGLPPPANVFLFINGLILLAGERARRRVEDQQPATTQSPGPVLDAAGAPQPPAVKGSAARSADELAEALLSDTRISRLSYRESVYVGLLQILALLPGISRSGVTMVGGLWRGLSHEDAARFAFLLATPVILAAGVLKLPSLAGHAGDHIHGQVIVGSVICGITAYLTVRFLVRYFETRTLTPFAIYSLIAGAASLIRFAF